MCFCEPVSFAAGGVLIVGGAFAGWKALKINKRYFPVSQMPTLAGLQQFMEGHVWMGVNNSDPSMVWWAAMGFIFFSWLTYLISIFLLVTPAMISTYLHIRLFGLTLIAVTIVVYLFLTYAYISFFCFLAGLGTIHLIYIIVWNKCCRECPEMFR